jgi:hypothetical protein
VDLCSCGGANGQIDIEDKTASLYAALWDEALSFSGPR